MLVALALGLASPAHTQESPEPEPEPVPAEPAAEPTKAERRSAPPAPTSAESAAAAAPSPKPRQTPDDLRDVGDWVQWKNSRQIAALPAESRLFYRRGLLAQQSGQRAEALADVRGAIELDPSFVQPHLTMAGWLMFSDPSQMLVHLASIVEHTRRDFNMQIDLAANVLVMGLEALFAGLLFAGLILVFLHRDELQHTLEEQLKTWISPFTAHWWAPVVLLVPFLAGLGLTLPVLLFLGMLWPRFRLRERMLTSMLALAALASPFVPLMLDRFTVALRTDARPFHEAAALQHAAWDDARQARLEAAAKADPQNGFAAFALGWHSRRGGRLEQAEQAYQSALQAWPEHSAVLTDLGNVAAMRGDTDGALEYYRRATTSDPLNAAAHFNAAQLLTRRFEYTDANRELQLASAIDFELVRLYQARAGASGLLPLVDVWPGPRTFWTALRDTPQPGVQPLPLALRGHIESSGWPFAIGALLALSAGIWLGHWLEQRLPLRRCTNCEVVVCRRCAKRRREAAMCEACELISAGAETREFSRVLLLKHRARRKLLRNAVATGFATLIPGYGLLAHRRMFSPVLLLTSTWLLGQLALGKAAPYSLTARLALPGSGIPGLLICAGFAFLYVWSMFGYLVVSTRERQREAALGAAAIGRITQSTRRQPTLAA
jgi:Tfp pilus assembly protein PilF